jgi:response regulator NasT
MPQIEVTMARWEAFLKVEEQATDLEDKLETRKSVDRAKGILMDQYGLKEQEAFRRIQVQSMNTRKSMREIAEAIIIAHNV